MALAESAGLKKSIGLTGPGGGASLFLFCAVWMAFPPAGVDLLYYVRFGHGGSPFFLIRILMLHTAAALVVCLGMVSIGRFFTRRNVSANAREVGLSIFCGLLPLMLLHYPSYFRILDKIAAVCLLIGLATYGGFWFIRRFPQTRSFLWFSIGLGCLAGGGAMYINQYHFLHKALLVYAWLFLFLSYPVRLKPTSLTVRAAIFMLGGALLLIGLLAASASAEHRFRTLVQTAYGKYIARFGINIHFPLEFFPPPARERRAPEQEKAALVKTTQDRLIPRAEQIQGTVVILLDALRARSMSLYGATHPTTPVIDEWAHSAWVFNNHYSNYPSTMLTLRSLFHSDYVPTVKDYHDLKMLKKSGVALELLYSDEVKLFYYPEFNHKKIEPQTGPQLPALVDAAVTKVKELRAGKKPFLLFVHVLDIHSPYRRHKNFDYGSSSQARYLSEISRVDRALAPLLNYLAAPKVRTDTMTILTSDHGEEFREHGGKHHTESVYSEINWVPLLVMHPQSGGSVPGATQAPAKGPVRSGRRIFTATHHLDLLPTLINALAPNRGAQVPVGTGAAGADNGQPLYHGLRPYRPRLDLISLAIHHLKPDRPLLYSGRMTISHTPNHMITGPLYGIQADNVRLIVRPHTAIRELYLHDEGVGFEQGPLRDERINLLFAKPRPYERIADRLEARFYNWVDIIKEHP